MSVKSEGILSVSRRVSPLQTPGPGEDHRRRKASRRRNPVGTPPEHDRRHAEAGYRLRGFSTTPGLSSAHLNGTGDSRGSGTPSSTMTLLTQGDDFDAYTGTQWAISLVFGVTLCLCCVVAMMVCVCTCLQKRVSRVMRVSSCRSKIVSPAGPAASFTAPGPAACATNEAGDRWLPAVTTKQSLDVTVSAGERASSVVLFFIKHFGFNIDKRRQRRYSAMLDGRTDEFLRRDSLRWSVHAAHRHHPPRTPLARTLSEGGRDAAHLRSPRSVPHTPRDPVSRQHVGPPASLGGGCRRSASARDFPRSPSTRTAVRRVRADDLTHHPGTPLALVLEDAEESSGRHSADGLTPGAELKQ